MGRKTKCRLWWPSNLSFQTSPNSSFLFGWFIPISEASLDVIVSFACNELQLTSSTGPRLDLQEILQRTNKSMPALVQDKTKFCLLGHCEADVSGNRELVRCANIKNNYINSTSDQHLNTRTSDHVSRSCGCSKHDDMFKQCRIASLESMWIRLAYGPFETTDGRVLVIPTFDHLHLNSQTMSNLDLHVIIYEIPNFGGHHYSLGIHSQSNVVPSTYKKPKWFDDLHRKNAHLNLALNSANAAQIMFDGHHHAEPALQLHIVRMDWSCVEFAEKAAFNKHSMWSNVMVDILLGNFFCIPLWLMAEPACFSVSNFAHDFTNDWLRNGCVWLMGNPAGFKLNTELAGVLGMISLNAIQIWSTLWIFMGFFFVYFTKGIALCGIIFGLTSAAALVIDVISLVTMHVLTLHLFLSLIYSTQIQALAALWRLFRGKKGNPLRHRLDSYEYNVEQHVVGSLLFTPILLLLPTTSAFHIFFTILHTAVSFFCIVLENAISFIHFTPYAKVFLWLVKRSRFPSGIWFGVSLCQHSETGALSGSNLFAKELRKTTYAREVVRPHYRYFYSSFSRSSIGSLAYGLLTGRSVLYASGPILPVKLPWIDIPWKEYWCLCRDSVYACREDPFNFVS
ncbi:phosphatidylinositol n-acetylglucosaminyltransferase subunit q [Phtheirospermum japonicum]|uniref:Phosphatidylinositol n-acetylglucosaminyltransferase subunit q n=1 Tax=Phtheirospermum japonicum TaxID=374723 RepID=A0A830CAA6_9LAMI|nr:phosphatidylinositol n-acetylglucosaminyltransferase subunit q [Phtheirospermum japonicum]